MILNALDYRIIRSDNEIARTIIPVRSAWTMAELARPLNFQRHSPILPRIF